MKKIVYISFLFSIITFSQETDSIQFKKKILEATEIDFLFSYYNQEGVHSAVQGGKGTEELKDITPTLVISYPLNDDSKLTADVGISAFTSASLSNVNPFDGGNTASPWNASSGPSEQNALASAKLTYTKYSDSRDFIWKTFGGFSSQYGYTSINFGGGIVKLWNEKNTEVNVDVNAFVDKWSELYPEELQNPNNLASGYNPSKYSSLDKTNRNTIAASVGFSQILTENMQISLSMDVVSQSGLLSTPYNRVYFSDKSNYFVEDFHLADDIEKLPDTRLKFPIGMRLNYYLNEHFIVRTYYRYYSDDWGIKSHTFSLEVPIKIGDMITIYPTYRYYTQTAADYFNAYDSHLSTQQFYTSDYDLSKFNSSQFGGGIKIAPTYGLFHFSKNGLYMKQLELRYQRYDRSDGLNSNLISLETKFSF